MSLPKSLFLTFGAFIIGSSLQSFAQNNYPLSGNVGLGTNSAQAQLHVKGGQIIETSGGGTNVRTLTIMNSGTNQINFGSYDGTWRSSIQIQNNDASKVLFLAPPEVDYNYSILRSVNGGMKLDVGGNFGTIGTNALTIETNGNVGIGTSPPSQYKFDVNGDSRISGALFMESAAANAMLRMKPLSGSGASRIVDFFESPDVTNSAYAIVGIANSTWGAPIPSVCLISGKNGSGGPTKDIMMWAHDAPNASNTAMTIKANSGNVLIGKTSQTNTSYKLDINGNARANKLVVNTSGADFVFEDDYSLRTLEEVQMYIRQNKHLPEIPSAKEMVKEGLDVGEMNIKLLQKIEELTLYLIEFKKENDTLKQRIEKLEDKK